MENASRPGRWISFSLLALATSQAATVTKSDTSAMLSNATNWSAAPTSSDTGSFTGTLSALNAASMTLGGNLSIGNLTFGNALNGPVSITDVATLTLNSGTAITATAANQNVVFNCPIVITTAGNTFEANNNLATSLTFNGSITSTQKIIWRAGNGTFSGGGSYSALGIGSRAGVTSTLSIGANNGIATNAVVTVGEANGTSRLDLAGFNQTVAGIQKGAATGVIGNSSTTADSTLTVTGTSSYGGLIQDSFGAGTRKTGLTIDGGLLTLSAANTYTGSTIIRSGTLKLDGTGGIAASQTITVGDAGSSGTVLDVSGKTTGFTLGAAQTLNGIGQINATGKTVTIDGTLAPGNSTGKLSVSSAGLVFSSSAVLSLELAGGALPVAGSTYDQLGVEGTIAIDPFATLDLSVLGGGTWSPGSLFFLIANDGTDAISGSFAGYGEGALVSTGPQWFRVTYRADSVGGTFDQGNDMALMAVPEPAAAAIGSLGLLLLFRRRVPRTKRTSI